MEPTTRASRERAIVAALAEASRQAQSLCDEFRSMPSDGGRRQAFAIALVTDAVLIADGVIAECRSGRSRNAVRLSRYVLEADHQLAYGTQSEENYDKLLKDDAAKRTQAATSVDLDLESFIRARLEGFEGKGAGTRVDIATALGRKGEYDELYRVISWVAHPGMSSGALLDEEDGSPKTDLGSSALAVTFASLTQIARTADILLGPVPGLGARIDECVERAERCIQRLTNEYGAAEGESPSRSTILE